MKAKAAARSKTQLGPNAGLSSVGVVVVAAGSGTRMGRPKQFLPIAGRPMAAWSVDAFLALPEVREVAVVLSAEHLAEYGKTWNDPRVKTVKGGATRLESVRNGLKALSSKAALLAVHDGARPLVTAEIIRACLAEAARHGAALPAVAVKDTLKEVSEGVVQATPDRARFWAAQTPQCYRAEVLRETLERFKHVVDATDESQLVEHAGTPVRIVASSYENLKVTTPEDLVVADALMKERLKTPAAATRTGFGYDFHRLVKGRPLMLAGMRVPHGKGLLGHSDGDVVLHAVGDALLGAAGLGEIGQHFPPSDPKIKGIASSNIIKKVLSILAENQARIAGVDVTVVAEEPKLKPHYEALKSSLAALLKVPKALVNVKAKTAEGLGEIGRGEAVACYAVATLTWN